jgi:two-component system cell cycle response regulator DivK
MAPLVLCVEDCADDRLLINLILKSLGCTVIEAVDGESALAMLQRCQPALILLDICLPRLSGLELLAHLRQNRATAIIPVIVVTAMAMADDRDRILAAGVDDYISKPYAIEDLERLVLEHLRRLSLSVATIAESACINANDAAIEAVVHLSSPDE